MTGLSLTLTTATILGGYFLIVAHSEYQASAEYLSKKPGSVRCFVKHSEDTAPQILQWSGDSPVTVAMAQQSHVHSIEKSFGKSGTIREEGATYGLDLSQTEVHAFPEESQLIVSKIGKSQRAGHLELLLEHRQRQRQINHALYQLEGLSKSLHELRLEQQRHFLREVQKTLEIDWAPVIQTEQRHSARRESEGIRS